MEQALHEKDIKTRSSLAYIWTLAIIALVAYILYRWGQRTEILTLIIGFVTGTASTILGVYFGAPIGVKKLEVNATKTTEGSPMTIIQPAENIN